MWNIKDKKVKNCSNLQRITYRCSDEDLGIKKLSGKEKQRKAYAKIFEKQAHSNMKERLKNFSEIQSKLNQQNHEDAKSSH